jgi:hypothetical protein
MYAFLLGGRDVSLSSAEAEYVSEAHAAKEALWLWQLLDSLVFPQVNPMVINKANPELDFLFGNKTH